MILYVELIFAFDLQELRNSWTLMKDEMDLWVGNRTRVVALAIGTYYLTLPSGLVLQLSNCYYVPTMSNNIISISCLDNEGFILLLRIIIYPSIMGTYAMVLQPYHLVFML